MDLEIAKLKSKILMLEHGLIQNGWKFTFNRRTTSLGVCSYYKRTIFLSEKYTRLNDWEPEMKDTVLHEISHALCGPGQGHNWTWKMKCREIGAKPCRLAQGEFVSPPRKTEKKYVAHCCGKKYQVQRRGKYFHNYICKICRAGLIFKNNPAYV